MASLLSTCRLPSSIACREPSARPLLPAARLAACLLAALALGACGREPEIPAGAATPTATGPALGAPRVLPGPAGPGSGEPHLAAAANGDIVMSWIEPDGEGHVLKHAQLRGEAWSAPVVVARGMDWVVSAADLPSAEPVNAQLWAAHWRVEAAGDPFAYDVAMAVSTDGGATWTPPRLLNDDGTATEHGFVSLFDWDGAIGAVWLDGRDLAQSFDDPESAAAVGTNLRYARLSAAAEVLDEGVIDAFACDCCKTGVAAGAAGTLVVYRDRTPEEIRDIAVRRRTALSWSDPVVLGPDGWEIEGCPVNGPAIAAQGTAAVAAWFTAPANRPRVRAAFSLDAGATFGSAIDVDTDGAQGHVGVALVDTGHAVVSWWRRGERGGAELAVRTVAVSGELGPITVVAETSASRPDDVPQMALGSGRLIFAWTEPGAPAAVKLVEMQIRE